jgi:predicted ATPase
MITSINVKGFKSFREFSIQPGQMNLVIGANGTGKSNLAELVRFIARLPKEDLRSTINNMGGENNIRTKTTAGAPLKFHLEFELDQDKSRGIEYVRYGFELNQGRRDIGISSEWLTAKVYKRTAGKPKTQGIPLFDSNNVVELSFKRNAEKIDEVSDELIRFRNDFQNIESDSLLLSAFSQIGEFRTITDYIGSWRAYNIDAALSKQAMGKGDFELSMNGDNLVPFLIRLLKDKSLRESLITQIQEPVPYIKDIQPEYNSVSQTLRFSEIDSGNDFYLSDMSDGTIRLLGLFAIFIQKIPPAILLLEEPENALHRYAISRVINLAYEVATRKDFPSQVFLTSHSPIVADEILRADKLLDKKNKTRCFVSQREKNSIISAPEATLNAIANNIGRPSEFMIDDAMGDKPIRIS